MKGGGVGGAAGAVTVAAVLGRSGSGLVGGGIVGGPTTIGR